MIQPDLHDSRGLYIFDIHYALHRWVNNVALWRLHHAINIVSPVNLLVGRIVHAEWNGLLEGGPLW